MYCIQHCVICRPSDFTVSEDAGIERRTVANSALAVRRSNHRLLGDFFLSYFSAKKFTFPPENRPVIRGFLSRLSANFPAKTDQPDRSIYSVSVGAASFPEVSVRVDAVVRSPAYPADY